MRKPKYQPGDQVNNWTVIDYDTIAKRYRVMCACGHIAKHRLDHLKLYPNCFSCGNKVKSEPSLIGERFGMRVVLAETERSRRRRQFLVECDCGSQHVVDLYYLFHARNLTAQTCRLTPHA